VSDLTDREHDTAPSDDLTPREVAPVRRKRLVPALLVAVIAVAIVALFVNVLGDASLFFKNVDEAVRDRDELGSERFQVQGTVVDGSVAKTELDRMSAVRFTIAFNGVQADVVHIGDAAPLFKAGEAVVLEGKWTKGSPPQANDVSCSANDGWYFASDRMYAKHDSDYSSKEGDRLQEAQQGGRAHACGVTSQGT
jgi:cytochrome c-type biogenesis protein CcmE